MPIGWEPVRFIQSAYVDLEELLALPHALVGERRPAVTTKSSKYAGRRLVQCPVSSRPLDLVKGKPHEHHYRCPGVSPATLAMAIPCPLRGCGRLIAHGATQASSSRLLRLGHFIPSQSSWNHHPIPYARRGFPTSTSRRWRRRYVHWSSTLGDDDYWLQAAVPPQCLACPLLGDEWYTRRSRASSRERR